jgi:iron complex outermembrane receptor protein
MQRKALRVMIAAALAGSAGTVAQTGWAQQPAAGGLEEIVVTATRRAQDLQEVPISIVAITGDGLETRGLDSLEDVGQSVPNIVITGGGASTGNTSFRVRGIPNVGTYVDGVWQVGTGGFLTQEFVELDRIEIPRAVRCASGRSVPPKISARTSRPRSARSIARTSRARSIYRSPRSC